MNLRIYNKILQYLDTPKNPEKHLEDLSKEELYLCDELFQDIEKDLDVEEPDFTMMWKEIDTKTKYDSFGFVLKMARFAAAAIIITVLSVMSRQLYLDNSIIVNSDKSVCDTNSNQPSLFLANGEIINLCKSKNTTISQIDGIELKNKLGKTISYKLKKQKTAIKAEYNTIVIPKSCSFRVELSDGTVVNLNSETKFKYPTHFVGDTREVEIDGEAYFSVAKNKNKPFVVKCGDTQIKVLGTSFNINSYHETGNITTTLVEGSVQLRYKENKILLKPDQQAIACAGNIEVKKVDTRLYTSWVDGVYYFDNKKMSEIMTQIERWYDVNVVFINKNLKNKIFTGVLKKECSLREMLEMIEMTDDLKIRLVNKIVYVE
ncbi:MAG: FecR domain-containing protein [Marinifilaceae bacterium]|jgi:hypothetical protein|nr:FecR domain-containing protein [Marinifilaceae bacterium]